MSATAPNATFPITGLVPRLLSGIPDTQAVLDREWLTGMRELAAIASAVPGSETLLRTVAPSRMSCTDATLEIRSLLGQSRETGFALSLRPLDMSFVRRYGSGSYSICTLAISVRQLPAAPGFIGNTGG